MFFLFFLLQKLNGLIPSAVLLKPITIKLFAKLWRVVICIETIASHDHFEPNDGPEIHCFYYEMELHESRIDFLFINQS